MKRMSRVRVAVLIGGLALAGLSALFTHKRVNYLDYHSGIVRSDMVVFGATYKSTERETWITRYAPPYQDPSWGLMGIHHTFSPATIRINTKAGRILHTYKTLDNYSAYAGADDESKRLIAEWVLSHIHDMQIKRDQFVIAIRAFECFIGNLPFPDAPDESVTYEQVQETIEGCTLIE